MNKGSRELARWDVRTGQARVHANLSHGLGRPLKNVSDATPKDSWAISERELQSYECMTARFDVDVDACARGLLEFDQAPVSLGLYPLVRARHNRIILTGMGESHFAALPSWRRLVSRGRATWWIEAGQLVDSPELITPDSLLIVTSWSGMCTELVALVEKFDEASRPAAVVAITDEFSSPLAEAADCEILLRSDSLDRGKGFLNALAAHDYLASMVLSEDSDDVGLTARVVASTRTPSSLGSLACDVAANPQTNMAYIGFREYAAAALHASLLTTEETGFPSEGYIGGQFCQGPMRRADKNLTAMIFSGRDSIANASACRLAADLLTAGSTVIMVTGASATGAINIPSPAVHVSGQVAHGVVVAEHFVAALAAHTSSAPR
jgi:fructoselysine-6-P-deglycase FrlB-like protein